MRHVYQLQTETIKVLKTREGCIADEMNVKDRYIYAILAGGETDPFAKFLGLYTAAVRAGAPVHFWEEKLAAIRTRQEARERLCVVTETAHFAKESTDVSMAEIRSDEPHAKLREVREAIAQGKRTERALLCQIEGNGNGILPPHVKAEVEQRRKR